MFIPTAAAPIPHTLPSQPHLRCVCFVRFAIRIVSWPKCQTLGSNFSVPIEVAFPPLLLNTPPTFPTGGADEVAKLSRSCHVIGQVTSQVFAGTRIIAPRVALYFLGDGPGASQHFFLSRWPTEPSCCWNHESARTGLQWT